MSNNGRKRRGLLRNNSPCNPSNLSSRSDNQSALGSIEVDIHHQLIDELIESLERIIRAFLKEIDNGKSDNFLESKTLFDLVQDLIIYTRYQRYDMECWRRKAEKLRQLKQGLPCEIAQMKNRLVSLRLEKNSVLKDLRDIKKRRRNRRRRR